ncbi:hypothetical protein VZT92_021863 [Zoarces viviparus]|uniref:Uncharacterized protein n=1 Tax=Zoarces viviparus TaxID=48416 RepID=A0AAW1EA06_ZOAVI
MDRKQLRALEVGGLLLTGKTCESTEQRAVPSSPIREPAWHSERVIGWLGFSAGLATLLAQQASLSRSRSCCSARQDGSQLDCCHVPFKAPRRSWGRQQLLSHGSRRNSGPLVISGNQCAGTSLRF